MDNPYLFGLDMIPVYICSKLISRSAQLMLINLIIDVVIIRQADIYTQLPLSQC